MRQNDIPNNISPIIEDHDIISTCEAKVHLQLANGKLTQGFIVYFAEYNRLLKHYDYIMTLYFSNEHLTSRSHNYYCALRDIRAWLEHKHILLLCKASQPNVFVDEQLEHSIYAYEIVGGRVNSSALVSLLARADVSQLGYVEEQDNFVENYLTQRGTEQETSTRQKRRARVDANVNATTPQFCF